MNEVLKKVIIYTDGAAEPNPGPGGYGVVLIHGTYRKELCGGFRRTTNNRMEILAAIEGLQALKTPCDVTLHSDSKYLVDAMAKGWTLRWQAKGWRRSKREKVVNTDLWERLLSLCAKHQVGFRWVKGHAGNRENERCDALAMQVLQGRDLRIDDRYEQEPLPSPKSDDPPKPTETKPGPAKKITAEGQPCRKCSALLVRRVPRRKARGGREYYFEYYLCCPKCGTLYMIDDAKRYYDDVGAAQQGAGGQQGEAQFF